MINWTETVERLRATGDILRKLFAAKYPQPSQSPNGEGEGLSPKEQRELVPNERILLHIASCVEFLALATAEQMALKEQSGELNRYLAKTYDHVPPPAEQMAERGEDQSIEIWDCRHCKATNSRWKCKHLPDVYLVGYCSGCGKWHNDIVVRPFTGDPEIDLLVSPLPEGAKEPNVCADCVTEERPENWAKMERGYHTYRTCDFCHRSQICRNGIWEAFDEPHNPPPDEPLNPVTRVCDECGAQKWDNWDDHPQSKYGPQHYSKCFECGATYFLPDPFNEWYLLGSGTRKEAENK